MFLGALGVVAVLGLGSLTAPQLLGGSDSEQATDAAGSPTPTANDRALHAHVQGLLAHRENHEPAPRDSEISTKESPNDHVFRETRHSDGTEYVPSCISKPLARSEAPLAVDRDVTYGNSTGYLIVLPHPGGGRDVDAYLVDDSCLREDPPAKGRLVVKRTFPRE